MANGNREIKSSLFADLFADDELVGKKNFLSLYNAIHGTDLKLEDTVLERKTIPQNIFRSVYNDISMLVNNKLIVFIEHQNGIAESLPVIKKCDILKQYCDFIEIIYRLQVTENAESKEAKAKLLEKAVREAIKKNILPDYLKRKCTEVINMFLDPYNYELDLEVQKEEAFEDGANKKAEESAINLLKEGISENVIARCVGLPLVKIHELSKEIRN